MSQSWVTATAAPHVAYAPPWRETFSDTQTVGNLLEMEPVFVGF